VLSVPTSAVTTDGTSHTVTVVENGTPKVVTVQIGAVGSAWTAITKGLTNGQVVALADLSAPLPGSATAAQTKTQTGGGQGRNQFGGAGGGGFRGGGGGAGRGGGGARVGG
jgi:uncharacterized membrane protein YgcG